MAIILISNINNPVINRGDIIKVVSDGHSFGLKEGQPNFVKINVTDATLQDVLEYRKSWMVDLQFAVVNSNVNGYRLRIFSNNVNSLKGFITRDQVENFITEWNGSVFSSAQNEVVFDIGYFNASTSEEFMERPANVLSQISFTELSIDATNIEIRADYSATNFQSTGIEMYLINKNATINSHTNRIIEYTIPKQTIIDRFQDDFRRKMNVVEIERRQYYITETQVDAIITAGWEIDRTLAQVITNINDKLDD